MCCEPQNSIGIRSYRAALIRGVRKLKIHHWLRTVWLYRLNGTLIWSELSRVGGLGLQSS